MEYVEPIRDKRQINAIKRYLTQPRDRLLFVMGINSALRISDLLKMRIYDVIDENGKPRQSYTTREQKTGKSKSFPFNRAIQDEIKAYVNRYRPGVDVPFDAPLFFSRKKDDGSYRPITRQHAYEIINEAARAVGITEPIGTHTMRKTFGYHAYRAGVDLAVIQRIFNHSSPRETLRYIGISKDDVYNVYLAMNL